MYFVEHWIDRVARSRGSGVKCPRSMPSLRESCVSMEDETEISTKRALSPGLNRPKPSAMFFVDGAADALIWLRNSKSFDAEPLAVSAYTSRFNVSASCHASGPRIDALRPCSRPLRRAERRTRERR